MFVEKNTEKERKKDVFLLRDWFSSGFVRYAALVRCARFDAKIHFSTFLPSRECVRKSEGPATHVRDVETTPWRGSKG